VLLGFENYPRSKYTRHAVNLFCVVTGELKRPVAPPNFPLRPRPTLQASAYLLRYSAFAFECFPFDPRVCFDCFSVRKSLLGIIARTVDWMTTGCRRGCLTTRPTRASMPFPWTLDAKPLVGRAVPWLSTAKRDSLGSR